MPRRRPAAPCNIANPNEIPDAPQMIAERYMITHLARTIQDTWSST